MTVGYAKVILFGEHAVVHGQPALAAALSACVRLVHAQPSPTTRVVLNPGGTLFEPNDGTRLGLALAALCDAIGTRPQQRITLDSSIPPGAGLGSSAAMAVALARHFAPGADMPSLLGAARAWECVFHSNPSGVDHTTSALGGVIRFQRGAEPEFGAVKIQPLPLVIAQMQAGADTGRMVDGVRDRLARRPGPMTAALQLLGDCAREALPVLVAGDIEAVGELMDIAQGGLAAIGVSTGRLDAACDVARAAGAAGAKLTGAGGGGCVIAACQPQQQSEVARALEAAGALRVLATHAGVTSP
jgi:mevalonate kinase